MTRREAFSSRLLNTASVGGFCQNFSQCFRNMVRVRTFCSETVAKMKIFGGNAC